MCTINDFGDSGCRAKSVHCRSTYVVLDYCGMKEKEGKILKDDLNAHQLHEAIACGPH